MKLIEMILILRVNLQPEHIQIKPKMAILKKE